MATVRIFLFSSVFSLLFSSTIVASNSYHDQLQDWQSCYLAPMSPEDLQYTANFFLNSYAVSLAELKVRQFSTPISQLHYSIKKKLINYQNCSDELTMLRTLLDRLSYVNGARTIYLDTLSTCAKYLQEHPRDIINAALESTQLNSQTIICNWAQEKKTEFNEQLLNLVKTLGANNPQIQNSATLFHAMSINNLAINPDMENKELKQAIESDEGFKSVMIIDAFLRENHTLLDSLANMTDAINRTTDYAEQIVAKGAEIYKAYYAVTYNMITESALKTHYATTMFGMYDLLADEYKTVLPDPDHVFEHMLQTTKLYTQAELLPKQ